jgi:hypothetical protein
MGPSSVPGAAATACRLALARLLLPAAPLQCGRVHRSQGARAPPPSLSRTPAAGYGVDTDKHAATLTKGSPGVLHGSYSLLIQDAEGQVIDPHSISAG